MHHAQVVYIHVYSNRLNAVKAHISVCGVVRQLFGMRSLLHIKLMRSKRMQIITCGYTEQVFCAVHVSSALDAPQIHDVYFLFAYFRNSKAQRDQFQNSQVISSDSSVDLPIITAIIYNCLERLVAVLINFNIISCFSCNYNE